MSDELDDFLSPLRSGIEERLREQLMRHAKVNPAVDQSHVVDIQIAQEREKLNKAREDYETNGQYELANFVEALTIEWLPELAKELKSR